MRPYYTDIDRGRGRRYAYAARAHESHPAGTLRLALAGYFQGIPMASPKSFETYGKDWVRIPAAPVLSSSKNGSRASTSFWKKTPTTSKRGLPYLDTLEIRIMKDPLDGQYGAAHRRD